jgi:hypothetical protein
MARTISSPGIQITEKDLTLRSAPSVGPVGTNVVVPGFAAQGPSSEPLLITTTSELEAIYGIPTTPAERYFYYTCKEVLNSPAVLTTVRLPYGQGTGSGFAQSYSGLFYPMTSGVNPTLGVPEWKIGTPKHVSLSQAQYSKITEGDFDWTGTGVSEDLAQISTGGGAIDINAGFFILNDLQTSVNDVSEGYYVGFADNSAVFGSSPNFDSLKKLVSLSAANTFAEVVPARLDFALSATAIESNLGVTSVSEQLEKVGFIGFETTEFQDHVSLGVFRLRRSTADATLLSIGTSERYLGSFNFDRRTVSPTGGILTNAYIEDIINSGSPTIKIYINPAISKEYSWTSNSTMPTTRVTVKDTAKALYPVGVYTPDSKGLEESKVIGSIPGKLEKALRLLETPENSTVDVIVDGGLSTIYSTSVYLSTGSYNDEMFIADPINLAQDWAAVANTLVNFAENTRKDCVAILDPTRATFVNGRDSKVIEADGKNFTQNIYNPLRATAGMLESNFAAMYGNWVKVSEVFTGRRTWVPFSGYAAAVFARNDAVAQPWAAPGGMNRGTFNALDIAFNPNQKQRDRLYEISVNPVCFFTGDGYAIMGQKTLQTKPTAFDRINVRRLFLALERTVARTLKYFIFEPNTEFTRTRVRNTITPVFEFAKNTEGLYDYLIVVDDRNNTPETIDQNQLIVDIYIKPVRTAEFILVNFIATRTGQDFQELI